MKIGLNSYSLFFSSVGLFVAAVVFSIIPKGGNKTSKKLIRTPLLVAVLLVVGIAAISLVLPSAANDGAPSVSIKRQKLSTNIAWGKVTNGLQLGVHTDKLIYDLGEPFKIDIGVRNSGEEEAEIKVIHSSCYGWELIFTDKENNRKYSLLNHVDTYEKFVQKIISISAGEDQRVVSFVNDHEEWRFLREGEKLTSKTGLRSLPPSNYIVTVVHQDTRLTSGNVEIQITQQRASNRPLRNAAVDA